MSLCSHGIGQERTAEQRLIFLQEGLLADALLHELPVVIHVGVLLLGFAGDVGAAHNLVILGEELLEGIGIECALLCTEGGLCQHGVAALGDDVLQFGIGDCESQLLCLVLDNLVVDHRLPHLVAEHGHLVVGEGGDSIGELHHIDVFVHLIIEFLDVDTLTIHLADTLTALRLTVGERTHKFFGNECKQSESHYCDEELALASDFL